MGKAELILADEKTVVVLITKEERRSKNKVDIGGHMDVSKLSRTWLIIDVKLSFGEHLEYACQKIANATAAPTRMSPV